MIQSLINKVLGSKGSKRLRSERQASIELIVCHGDNVASKQSLICQAEFKAYRGDRKGDTWWKL